MELNRIGDITAFVAAVDAGSYTKAASHLGITRSAVGKCIIRLENRFGVRLLNRTSRYLYLTDEGRMVYERCQQILEDLDEVNNLMEQRSTIPSGTLRLTAPISFGHRHLLPVLEDFLSEWPTLRADVTFTDRYVDLVEEGFDIAIRIGESREDPRIMTRTIARQQMITCASPYYLERYGMPLVPEDLPSHSTVMFVSEGHVRSWKFETEEGIKEYQGPGRLHIDSAESMLSSALSGHAIAHLPEHMIFKELANGTLVEILKKYSKKPESVRLLYPSRRHISPRIRMFIDVLVQRWEIALPWKF